MNLAGRRQKGIWELLTGLTTLKMCLTPGDWGGCVCHAEYTEGCEMVTILPGV